MPLHYRNALCDTVAEVKPIFVFTYRVRNNLTIVHELVDPDPGKCYTKKMISKCPACCTEPEANINEEASKDQQWTESTSIIPKQFSFCNIQTYTQTEKCKRRQNHRKTNKKRV
jgi:hypothetical protein